MSLLRPGTLEAATSSAYVDPDSRRIAFVGFLDEFYLDRDRKSRFGRIADEPAMVEDERENAWLGAVADHLCQRWGLGTTPTWTERPERFLRAPWYTCSDAMRKYAFVESPTAFRRRFIFTEAEPLRRARTPKDGRWWAYEEMRNGMRPGPDDVETLPYEASHR